MNSLQDISNLVSELNEQFSKKFCNPDKCEKCEFGQPCFSSSLNDVLDDIDTISDYLKKMVGDNNYGNEI